MSPNQSRTFTDANIIATRFEAALRSVGVEIKRDSELASALHMIKDAEDRQHNDSPPPETEAERLEVARGLGVLQFAELLLVAHTKDNEAIKFLVPHLELLNNGEPAQNVRKIGDQAANKIFEALIALACYRFATDVKIDHPVESAGDNPDILFAFEGVTWGIACKTPNGTSPESALNLIEGGSNQIARCPATRGLIVLNARNWLDLPGLWPLDGHERYNEFGGAWESAEIPLEQMKSTCDRKLACLKELRGDDFKNVLRENEKLVPAVLVFAQAATVIRRETGNAISRVGTFAVWNAGELDEGSKHVIRCLDRALHELPSRADLGIEDSLPTDTPPSAQ